MILLISLLSFLSVWNTSPEVHPIHLSVTEFYAEEDQQSLGFSVTFFMDDFGVAAGYQKHANDINNGKMTVNDLILQYLNKTLKVKVNGKSIKYKIRETESNFPSVTCYMEIKSGLNNLESIEVENTMLLELFDDQKNMVHLRIPDKKQGSMILNHRKKSGVAKW